MATRTAARYVSQRLSSGARNLIEKENSAENIYIKKIELERLQKLASKAKTSSNKIHYLRREFWNLSKECKKLENELEDRYRGNTGYYIGLLIGIPFFYCMCKG